jgi:hypothetical protein
MTHKYAVIHIELFNRLEVEGVYSIIDERETYAIIEYTTEPDPTGEGWVIFEGEDSNVKCAEYLNEINE